MFKVRLKFKDKSRALAKMKLDRYAIESDYYFFPGRSRVKFYANLIRMFFYFIFFNGLMFILYIIFF